MDNEPLNIEDTSIYSRPMSASGQDKKVGQDELGNPVYQDVRGRTYIVKPNEQPFERPEGGFVRAAGRAIQNIPPVADWDFEAMGPAMARGAKAVGEVLWNVIDTPRATLTGERQPTFGDAWDVGGFAGSGGLVGASRGMIPEGALGVNVPYYRSRQAPKSQTPEAEGPINWEEYGLTPPADEPGWANITRRDLENYRLSDEMPDEWLGAHGMREDFWEALEFGDLSPFEPTGNAAFLEQAANRVLQQAPDDIGRASGAIAQFRSPVREVAEEITIPSKGLKGSEFIKHLQNNHTVRNSEVSAMDMQIDPSRRYTREELMEIVDQHAFTTEALGAGPKHSTMQRQPVLDPTVEYEEIMINASRQKGQPMFQPKHGQTHYDDNTIGHARVSVRQPDPEGLAIPDNRPYLLVEEMQSDLTQQGHVPARQGGQTSWADAVESQLRFHENPWGNSEVAGALRALKDVENPNEIFSNTFEQLRRGQSISSMDATEVRQYLQSQGVRDPEPTITTNPIQDYSDFRGKSTGRKFVSRVEEEIRGGFLTADDVFFTEEISPFIKFLEQNFGVRLTEWVHLDEKPNLFNWIVNKANSKPSDLEHGFIEDLQSILFEHAKRQAPVASPPVTSTTDSTRAIVQSLMAYADQQGVNEIVFPPLERIAAERFTPGTEGYNKAIKSGSGFHRTYVTSLQKVLKELERELGPNNVSVSQRNINYEPMGHRTGITEDQVTQANRDFTRFVQNAREDRVDVNFNNYLIETYGENILNAGTLSDFTSALTKTVDMPSQGISLQILNPEYDYSRPRFHKGGLVTRTKQALGEL